MTDLRPKRDRQNLPKKIPYISLLKDPLFGVTAGVFVFCFLGHSHRRAKVLDFFHPALGSIRMRSECEPQIFFDLEQSLQRARFSFFDLGFESCFLLAWARRKKNTDFPTLGLECCFFNLGHALRGHNSQDSLTLSSKRLFLNSGMPSGSKQTLIFRPWGFKSDDSDL